MLGIDMQGFEREAGSDELPPGVRRGGAPDTPPTSPPRASSSGLNTNATAGASTNAKPAEPEDVTMAEPEPEADDAEAKVKKDAEVEKQRGSEAYKKRDFEAAARSFERAWEIWPKDITFLTNLSGAWCGVSFVAHNLIGMQLCIWSRESMTSQSRLRRRLWRRDDRCVEGVMIYVGLTRHA